MAVQGAVSGKIRLAAPASTELELFAQRGLSERFQKAFARIRPTDPAPSAIAFSARRRVIVTDVPRDARASLYARASIEEGFTAMQSTPIFGAGGGVIGALSTHFASAPMLSSSEGVVLDFCAGKLARVLEKRFGRR